MCALPTSCPIAVDLTAGSLCAAQLTGMGAARRVAGLARAELPKPDEDGRHDARALAGVLKETVRRRPFRGRRVVLSLPPGVVRVLPCRFELKGGESAEVAMLRQAAGELPYPLAEALLDYIAMTPVDRQHGGGFLSVLVAAHRPAVEHYLHVFSSVGLVVEAVEYAGASVVRLHEALHAPEDRPLLLVHALADTTVLLVLQRGEVMAVRTVAWGMEEMVHRLMADMDLRGNMERVRYLLTRYGMQHGSERGGGPVGEEHTRTARAVSQLVAPSTERLLHEIYNMLGYVRAMLPGAPMGAVYVYGEAAWIAGLDAFITAHLNVPAQCVNPLDGIPPLRDELVPDPTEGAAFAGVLGLALRRLPWL